MGKASPHATPHSFVERRKNAGDHHAPPSMRVSGAHDLSAGASAAGGELQIPEMNRLAIRVDHIRAACWDHAHTLRSIADTLFGPVPQDPRPPSTAVSPDEMNRLAALDALLDGLGEALAFAEDQHRRLVRL